MKLFNRTLFALLIIIIPSACVLTAANISFRLADVYRYELNRSGVMKEINLDETTGNLARFFSDYMLGKLDNFQYTAVYMGRERPIFGVGEGTAMAQFRDMLNLSLACLVVMLLLILFITWFLLWQDRKEAVRIAYNAATALYVLMAAAVAALAVLDDLRGELLGKLFIYQFEESDLLPQLLPISPFLAANAVVIIIISLILLSVGRSGIKRLTISDRMFY